jgi:hypothetical protein
VEHHHGRLGWVVPGLLVGSALLWAATRPTTPPVVYQEPAPTVLSPRPYSYYPVPEPVAPVAVVPPIIQANPSPPANWWYYCRSSGAYYPYVKYCPSGWERVMPQP